MKIDAWELFGCFIHVGIFILIPFQIQWLIGQNCYGWATSLGVLEFLNYIVLVLIVYTGKMSVK